MHVYLVNGQGYVTADSPAGACQVWASVVGSRWVPIEVREIGPGTALRFWRGGQHIGRRAHEWASIEPRAFLGSEIFE